MQEGYAMDLRKAATAGTMESNDIMVTLEPAEVGGIPSIVSEGETGLMVPSGDAGRYAESIRKLLTDKTLAETISANSVKAALVRHDRQKIVSGLVSIYGQLAGE